MAALGAAIHAFSFLWEATITRQGVDARDKPGHDEL
jgi:hypothetical protein